jgi:hypothetical protein
MTLAAEILADSPLGFWKLDEASGTVAADSSGNGRDGTYTDAAMAGAEDGPCNIGGVAPAFASGDFVDVPANAAWSLTSTLTIEALVRRDPASPTVVAAIVSQDEVYLNDLTDASSNGRYNTYVMENGAEIEANNQFPFIDATIPCNFETKWAHIVFTKSGSGAGGTKVYIEGLLVASGAVPNFVASSHGLMLGRRGIPNDHYLVGSLSHVAIYGTALSAARVAAHWAEVVCPALCPHARPPVRISQRGDAFAGSEERIAGKSRSSQHSERILGPGTFA